MAKIIVLKIGDKKYFRLEGEIWEYNHVLPSRATVLQVSITNDDPLHYRSLSVPASLVPGFTEYTYDSESSKIIAIWGEGLYFNQRGELVGIPHETDSSMLEKVVVVAQGNNIHSIDVIDSLPIMVEYLDIFPDKTELSITLSVHAFGLDNTILKCSIKLIYALHEFQISSFDK